MAVQHGTHLGRMVHRSPSAVTVSTTKETTREIAVAAIRIGTGFLFLWAFLDKTFGLNYSTPSSHAWIHGGSPTKGFLSGVNVGPFASTFQHWAGQGWADWMFMLALLGIGLALILGIGLRVAAVAGIVLVAMMWAAVWPPAQHATGGALTGSTNPFVDEHVMDALALLAVAAFGTAGRLGLGALWAKLPFVQRHRILL
jgi:thiosulfate dehydrogenase (quinone) large subunit